MNEETHEPQASIPERLPPQLVAKEKLEEILAAHWKWVESDGKNGEKASLPWTDLRGDVLQSAWGRAVLQVTRDLDLAFGGVNLQGAYLCGAYLEGAYLKGANLKGAMLWWASLKGADLSGANLQEAQLLGVNLHESNLQNADLREATSLQAGQLARANVSNAKLPKDIHEFQGLEIVAEASKNARKIFISVLLGCVYSWLTIATTTDVGLLTNSASSPLPIIQTKVPIAGFYWAAPLVLLCLYVYLHIYLQRLWEGLAKLPAVFPDGRPLDERAYPWLLIGFVRTHFKLLQGHRPPLSKFQTGISILLAYWVLPATLFLFWGRYLTRHEWWGTALHIIFLCVSTAFGMLSYRLATATLKGQERMDLPGKMGTWLNHPPFQPLLLVVLLVFFSFASIEGLSWTDQGVRQERIAFAGSVPLAMAELRNRDLSIRPPDWSPTGEHSRNEIEQVKGAQMQGVNLRYAWADGAFLVNAELNHANISGATFEGAYLMGAHLSFATLTGASFHRAHMQFADLLGVHGYGAEFPEANLQDAVLSSAELNKANLRAAKLQRANCSFVELRDADIKGGDLKEANLWAADLRRADLSCIIILRGQWIVREKCTDLSSVDFSRADLRGAILDGAYVGRANFERADLRGANLSNIEGWEELQSLRLANVYGVINPPEGFVTWAIQEQGAVSLESDEEWEKVKSETPPSDAIRLYVPPNNEN